MGNKPSQLAQDTFEAFRPYINVFDPGIKYFDFKENKYRTCHTITKQDSALNRLHKLETAFYPDGRKFHPWRDFVSKIYSANHVQRHFEGEISYYTSGRAGLGLLYFDVDAHKSWQTDELRAKQLLRELYPDLFWRTSNRGQNGLFKIRYDTVAEFNELADRLQADIRQYLLANEILCDFEIKGTATDRISGSLAKLPFQQKYPGYMKDPTDNWYYEHLDRFKATACVNYRRVECIMGQIQIDENKANAFDEYKRRLDEEHKAAPNKSKPTPTIPRPVVTKATIQPKPSVRCSTVRVKTDLPPQDSNDAFRRNLKDLPPFVRAFYSQYRRYPTTEEALEWLHANGRYSGEWEDRENRRAKRVEQILNFLEPDFNPEMLSKGNSTPVSLNRETYSWWVRQTFGLTMTGRLTDLSRFDAETMKAPTSTVVVPAKFVETFLAVAHFCVQEDPLENRAVPTNRIKKIWAMVKNGSAWNQKYYQVVRDRLHRMGVISIFDRQHHIGKAWRWVKGENFPEKSFGEQQKKLKEKLVKRPPVSLVDFLEDTYYKNNNIHNTLYHIETQISAVFSPDQQVRPPPWTIV